MIAVGTATAAFENSSQASSGYVHRGSSHRYHSSSFSEDLGNLNLHGSDSYGLKKVRKYIHQYTTEYGWAAHFYEAGRYARIQTCKAIFRAEGVPEDLCWTMLVESKFESYAQSETGANGYWQFEPGTAAQYCPTARLSSVVDSSKCAAKYLKELHSETSSWALALAAYNGGPGTLGWAINRSGSHDFWSICQDGSLLTYQTREYVPQVLAAIEVGNHPSKYGFKIPGINE